MSDEGLVILPFYLVADVSGSMHGAKLAALSQVTPSVQKTLRTEPILADKVRFGLITFSDTAQVDLPLCDMIETEPEMPKLAVRGMTSYGSAFRLLRTEIESNVAALKADGYRVHRPIVFFMSDGAPTDRDWDAAFRELTSYDPATRSGFPTYPNVIPCGIGDADKETMARLVHPSRGDKAMRLYMMKDGADPAVAITQMAEVLISSMVETGYSGIDGPTVVVHPPEKDLPTEIKSYAAEDLV